MTHPFISRIAVVLAAALLVSSGLAAGQVRIDASSVPFSDKPSSVSVDLAWDGDLVLVLGEGGALPNADITVAGTLPTDALDRVIPGEAFVRSDGPELMAGGLSLTHDQPLSGLAASYAGRLQELGFSVGEVTARGFDFSMGEHAYRAVFSNNGDGGVQVYLGL